MIKKIEISADIKNVKTSLRELDSLLKSTTRRVKPFSILDKKETTILKDWAKKQIPEVQKSINKLKKDMEEMSDINLLLRTKQELVSLEKDLKKLENISIGKEIKTPKRLKDIKEGITEAIGNMSLGGFAVGGLGLALGGMGIRRGFQAYEQRVGEAPERLALAGAMGRGRYQEFVKEGGPYQGQQLGFDVNETLRMANELIRATGEITNLGQVQKTARAYGINPEQIVSQMGMLRRMGGDPKNTQRDFSAMLASAISSNLDQSLIAEYMAKTSEFVEQIASEGTADAREIARSVSGLVRQGGIFQDTQRATKALGSLHESIREAQGARFGFFAQSYERALGAGGQGIVGPQVLMALNQGLFGPNVKKLPGLTEEERKAFGKSLSFDERRRTVYKQFEDMTGDLDPYSKALISTSVTGIKDAAESLSFLRSIGTGKYTEKEMEKMYKKATASPEEKALMGIRDTLDLQLQATKAGFTNNLSKMGETVAQPINSLLSTVQAIEENTLVPMLEILSGTIAPAAEDISKVIGGIAKGFGFVTGTEEKRVTEEGRENISRIRKNRLERLSDQDISSVKKEYEKEIPFNRNRIISDVSKKIEEERESLEEERKIGIDPEKEKFKIERIVKLKKLEESMESRRGPKEITRELESVAPLTKGGLPTLLYNRPNIVPFEKEISEKQKNYITTPLNNQQQSNIDFSSINERLDSVAKTLDQNGILLRENTGATKENTRTAAPSNVNTPIKYSVDHFTKTTSRRASGQ